jgi:uncharacterized protein with PIN domain
MESTIRELIESVTSDHDKESTVQFLIDVYNAIQDSPAKFVSTMKNLVYDYCLDGDIMVCPKCCVELVTHEWKEPRPYGDTYAYETLAESKCPHCGEVY